MEHVPHRHEGGPRNGAPQRHSGGGQHSAGELLGPCQAIARQGPDRAAAPWGQAGIQEHLCEGIELVLGYWCFVLCAWYFVTRRGCNSSKHKVPSTKY